jgi:hypothetical protein
MAIPDYQTVMLPLLKLLGALGLDEPAMGM